MPPANICQYVECVIKRTPLPSSSLTPSSQPEASRMHPMPRNPASNCGTQYRPQSHFSRWSPPSSVLWCRTCADYATSVESLQLLTKRKGPTVIIYNAVEPLFYDFLFNTEQRRPPTATFSNNNAVSFLDQSTQHFDIGPYKPTFRKHRLNIGSHIYVACLIATFILFPIYPLRPIESASCRHPSL